MLIRFPLPVGALQVTERGGQRYVWDILRRRRVRLTPEEQVRQTFVHYLVERLGYPRALMANEVSLQVGNTMRRVDTVLYRQASLEAQMIVEYKAPDIHLSQATIDQAAAYNTALRAPYLILSNGRQHVVLHIDFDKRAYTPLPFLPPYSSLH